MADGGVLENGKNLVMMTMASVKTFINLKFSGINEYLGFKDPSEMINVSSVSVPVYT